MKKLMMVEIFSIVLFSMISITVYSEEAQQSNPLFVEAQNLLQQLNSSSLNDNAKIAWTRRFSNLEQTQQQLWVLAGQVDAGQCLDSCIDLYNNNVTTWESNLQSFIHDAQLTLSTQEHTPETMFECWNDCDKKHSTCWQHCLDGPIEENEACHAICNDEKYRCSNACQ